MLTGGQALKSPLELNGFQAESSECVSITMSCNFYRIERAEGTLSYLTTFDTYTNIQIN